MCVNCGSGGCGGCTNPEVPRGLRGYAGLSAYQIAVNLGYPGTEAEWIASLNGANGTAGSVWYESNGIPSNLLGNDGDRAIDVQSVPGQIRFYLRSGGVWGLTSGVILQPGLSAYQVAVQNGFSGNEAAWLVSLQGVAGTRWYSGIGTPAFSPSQTPAYYLQNNGEVWSWTGLGPWVDTTINLTGPPGVGTQGLSAYQVAVNNGFVGSESAWLLSLVGAPGVRGTRTGFGPEDPNVMSQTNWINGDVWCQTNIAGQVTYWQKVGGSWVVQFVLVASGNVVLQPYLFKAFKTAAQPFPIGAGSTSPQVITIDDDNSGTNFDAGNSWVGFKQVLPVSATGLIYKLENLFIHRVSGVGVQSTLTNFVVEIIKTVGGVTTVLATVTLNYGGNQDFGQAVLQTPPLSFNAADEIRVRVTATINLMEAFEVSGGCLFFNQD